MILPLMLPLPQTDMPSYATAIECRIQDAYATGKTQFCSLAEVISKDLLSFYYNKEEAISIQNPDLLYYEIIKPIPAVVQEEDGMFIASFVDANINASGESRIDAIQMLKSLITSRFRFYSKNEANLGAGPQQQLAVLRQFVREK